jgi:hypothetical protein
MDAEVETRLRIKIREEIADVTKACKVDIYLSLWGLESHSLHLSHNEVKSQKN